MPTLLLKFDSPIQSWGTSLKLKNHDTDTYPSKSGVIGLIASALGRSREEDISDLAALNFGVRIDKPGIVIDDFQVSEVPGKEKKIGHRKYLSDACFLCAIEADIDTLVIIEQALLHPAFALFSGRRGCPVTAELVQGIVEMSLLDALLDGDSSDKKIVFESREGYGWAVRDVPISFSPGNRRYAYRFIEAR